MAGRDDGERLQTYLSANSFLFCLQKVVFLPSPDRVLKYIPLSPPAILYVSSGLPKGDYYRKAILRQEVTVTAGSYMSNRVAKALEQILEHLKNTVIIFFNFHAWVLIIMKRTAGSPISLNFQTIIFCCLPCSQIEEEKLLLELVKQLLEIGQNENAPAGNRDISETE